MPIERIIDRRSRDLGGGLMVGRVLPFRARRMVGPFIFFDHMGPVDLPAGIPPELDVRPHPHIGLSTVTYLLSGQLTHRDSIGSNQEIRPGEVNWMVAGRGITHSERLQHARARGAHMDGIQTWVALPDGAEESAPDFSHHADDALPQWQEDGVSGRLIAGKADGLQAGVRTHSPLFYQHWEMAANSRRSIPTGYAERAAYCAHGEIDIAGTTINAGQMAVISSRDAVDIHAARPATVLVLGGDPVGERFMLWNFVSSSKERLRQAAEDWRQQRMPLPVGDDREFVPMPEQP